MFKLMFVASWQLASTAFSQGSGWAWRGDIAAEKHRGTQPCCSDAGHAPSLVNKSIRCHHTRMVLLTLLFYQDCCDHSLFVFVADLVQLVVCGTVAV
eukprot:3983338-Amphidinium_carterae.1